MPINYQKLLRGYYENERLPIDWSPAIIVPDFGYNILNMHGLLYKPVVDIEYGKSYKALPWPEGRSFAVCLTHDVDSVTNYSFVQSMRIRHAQLSQSLPVINKIRIALGYGIDVFRSLSRYGENDPLHCYERWLEAERRINSHSTFFFWPGLRNVKQRHPSDCMYDLTDTITFDHQRVSVAEMIREIDRQGWEIGLHASWHAYNDLEELKRQKYALEHVVGHEILSIRQHYLHYDISSTPRAHSDAGFHYDSTLGFTDNVGFRFGTCHPWPLYDLKKETFLPIVEIPLIIQDGALLGATRGLRLDEDTAMTYITQLAEEVTSVNGVLTLLWHPDRIIHQASWSLYIRALDYLKDKGAWFASVREVGAWWKEHQPQPQDLSHA